MITVAGTSLYGDSGSLYNRRVPGHFTVGDIIRKTRKRKGWTQTRLGVEAARFPLQETDVRINKSTVCKVEDNPYTSEFGTVWRLLSALGLSFGSVERDLGSPFIEHVLEEHGPVPKDVRRRRPA